MTAAELRALIQAASPMPWDASECGDVWSAGRQVCDYVPNEPDAALIVALRNNAERFAELLAAEEAKPDITWDHDDDYMDDPTDHNAIIDGQVVGWAYRNTDGDWYYCIKDTGLNGTATTEAEARAAVEDAVRAGR